MDNVIWFIAGVVSTLCICWWIAWRMVRKVAVAASAELMEKRWALQTAQHLLLLEIVRGLGAEIIRRDRHEYSKLMRSLKRLYASTSELSKPNFELHRQRRIAEMLVKFPDIGDFNLAANISCDTPPSRFRDFGEHELSERYLEIMEYMFLDTGYRDDEAIEYWLSEGCEELENHELVVEIARVKLEFESQSNKWCLGTTNVGGKQINRQAVPFGYEFSFCHRLTADPACKVEEEKLWIELGWEESTPDEKAFVSYFKRVNGEITWL